MTSNSLREKIPNQELLEGVWRSVYLTTVPGSMEKICVLTIAQLADKKHKVVRTLSDKSIDFLFGEGSKGINMAIEFLIDDVSNFAKKEYIANWELSGITGFESGQPIPCRSTSLSEMTKKAISMSTAIYNEQNEEAEQQTRFSQQLKQSIRKIDKQYLDFIDKKYTSGTFSTKLGINSPYLIGQYHGVSSHSSPQSADSKILALEDIRLRDMIQDERKTIFFIAPSDELRPAMIQRSVRKITERLSLRDIDIKTCENIPQMAETIVSTIRTHL